MTNATFCIWDATNPLEIQKWLRLWQSWSQREIFFHPNYLKLYANPKTRAVCAALESEDGCVLYPFLLRDLTAEPFWDSADAPASDITTPFGWGGPCFLGNPPTRDLTEVFWSRFNNWTTAQNVISEYVQFTLSSPMNYPGETIDRIQHIVRDLNLDEEVIWKGVQHKVRKNVNKAKSCGVTIEVDPVGDKLDDFLRLYDDTMARRSANRFPRDYFEGIHHGLSGQFVYFHAIHENSVISTELVLLSAESAYSFLGGTDASAFSLRPNDLLKYEAILWAKQQGLQRFILGGGNEPDDGIFRYKLPFAPHGSCPRYEGRRVFLKDRYEDLVNKKKIFMEKEGKNWVPRPGFFPRYRA